MTSRDRILSLLALGFMASQSACYNWDVFVAPADGGDASSVTDATDAADTLAPGDVTNPTDASSCGRAMQACCSTGSPCQPGLACMATMCAACPSGFLVCAGMCANPATDNSNCGRCGNRCFGGRTCQSGNCR